ASCESASEPCQGNTRRERTGSSIVPYLVQHAFRGELAKSDRGECDSGTHIHSESVNRPWAYEEFGWLEEGSRKVQLGRHRERAFQYPVRIPQPHGRVQSVARWQAAL